MSTTLERILHQPLEVPVSLAFSQGLRKNCEGLTVLKMSSWSGFMTISLAIGRTCPSSDLWDYLWPFVCSFGTFILP